MVAAHVMPCAQYKCLVIVELSEHEVAIYNFHSASITLCTVASIHSIQKRKRNSQKLGNNFVRLSEKIM